MKYIIKFIINLLAISLIALPFSASSGIISTETSVSSYLDYSKKDKVKEFLNRNEVISKFQQLGLTSINAEDRVNAMTSEEIELVVNKIDSLPSGGYYSYYYLTPLGWLLVISLLVALWRIGDK